MNTADILANLKSLASQVDQANQALLNAKKKFEDDLSLRLDYQRQIDQQNNDHNYHKADGISALYLAPLNNTLDQEAKDLDDTKGKYPLALLAAQTAYNNALSALTPIQQEALNAQNKIAVQDSQAAQFQAQAVATQANQQVIAQSTTKYLIWGVVAIVTIIIVALIIVKHPKP